jgi:hypothetical protein
VGWCIASGLMKLAVTGMYGEAASVMRLFLSAHLMWLTATQSTTARKQPERRR